MGGGGELIRSEIVLGRVGRCGRLGVLIACGLVTGFGRSEILVSL